MKSLALAGTLMLIGVMGGIKAELNLAMMMVKRQRIIGSVLRSRPIMEKAAIIDEFESTVMPLFAAGTNPDRSGLAASRVIFRVIPRLRGDLAMV
jgi:NADPH:quinone reductase-like Zn-dependent oxidoreductase